MRPRSWRRSITLKFVLPVAGCTLVLLAAMAAVLGFLLKAAAEHEVREQARLIEDQLSTVQAYITEHYVNPVHQSGASVPLPPPPVAIIEIARQLAEKGQFEARLVNARPRNPRNAPRDDFERTGLARLAQGEREYERFERVNGRLYYRRITPYVALVEGCATCHPGAQKGDVLGNLSVSIPYDRKAGAVAAALLALGAAALGLTAVLVFLIWSIMRRTVVSPLRAVEETARQVAAGHLDVPGLAVTGEDEIGQTAASFNTMLDRLRQMLARIRTTSDRVAAAGDGLAQAADQVAAAAHQIAAATGQVVEGAATQRAGADEAAVVVDQLRAAIDQIAEGAQTQANAVEQTQAAMHQMAQAVDQVAQLAQDVATRADHALSAAEDGGSAVREAVAAMARIRDTAMEAAGRVRELGEKSQQIGEIVRLIGAIAEQTDLLALNAAIEAARAGEHGRGFAVVAEEVRKLAERSARSTQEITSLVDTIREGVQAAVAAMDAATREVALGTELAGRVGSGLERIFEALRETNLQVQGISAAAEEMTAGVAEVVGSVDKVARITEEHAAATEEMAASSVQVADSVRSLAAVSHQTAAAAQQMSASTRDVTSSAEAIRGSAGDLATTAEELRSLMEQFRL